MMYVYCVSVSYIPRQSIFEFIILEARIHSSQHVEPSILTGVNFFVGKSNFKVQASTIAAFIMYYGKLVYKIMYLKGFTVK